MSLDRIRSLVAEFRSALVRVEGASGPGVRLPRELGRELLESMLLARHLDLAAHELRAKGDGHYTICSSGHEANVVFGRLTRPSDPSLVHYRSAALQIERARLVPGVDPVRAIALSLVASKEEPTSGGRHKVFGHKELGIIPQTSTIASHLPRAVGLGFGLEWRRALKLENPPPDDAIAFASFGDASVNHSTALGALNAASWAAHQSLPLPVLFVCEDNGLGVSVRSPEGWLEARLQALPHLRYFACDGAALDVCYAVAAEAIAYCRSKRRPAVLHLRCVRLLGHAGSDVDTAYRNAAEIGLARAKDPVLAAALGLVRGGVLSSAEVLDLERQTSERVAAEAERACRRPKLGSRAEVMAPIATPVGPMVSAEAVRAVQGSADAKTLAQGINYALAEAFERYPEALLFGEDVAKKGGVYGVTKGLFERFGPKRVFNTLLDEQTILGLGLGAATLGLLPIPELQYLAYLHNAEDQLRGEASTFQFFSDGAYTNPLFVRIAGLAYQKGFGGHFHNDNSLAVLRDIPGIVVMVPARADDAVELYRTGLALAKKAQRVVVSVEPIALYHRRDLFDEGDAAWLAAPGIGAAEFLAPRIYQPEARDLCIVTYGNGVAMSLRAARRLQTEHGIIARIVDLRWLAPLPIDAVLKHVAEIGRVLVVDECRTSGNVSEALAAALLDHGVNARFARVTSADSFIPLGDAAELVLVSEAEIVTAASALAKS